MSLMSFFDRQGIPETLVRTRTEKECSLEGDDENNEKYDSEDSTLNDEFEDDILILRNYSFISVNTDKKTFEMHRLVQLATRKWLEVHAQLERWKQ